MDHNITHSKIQLFSTYTNPKTKLTVTAKVKQAWSRYEHNPKFRNLDDIYILQSTSAQDYQFI